MGILRGAAQGLAAAMLLAALAQPEVRGASRSAAGSETLRKAREAFARRDWAAAEPLYLTAHAEDELAREAAIEGLHRVTLARRDHERPEEGAARLATAGAAAPLVAYLRGQWLRAGGLEKQAQPWFEKAIQGEPGFPEAHVALAEVLKDAKDPRSYREHLRRAIECKRVSTQAHRLWQDANPEGLSVEQIVERYEKLCSAHPDDPRWNYLASRNLKDWQEQVRRGREGIRRHPDYYWSYHLVGYQLPAEQEQERLDLWKAALAACPEQLLAAVNLASLLTDLGLVKDSGPLYGLVCEIEPRWRKDSQICLGMGKCRLREGKAQEAAEAFRSAMDGGAELLNAEYLALVIDRFPNSGAAHANLSTLHVRKSDYKTAREHADAGRRVDPASHFPWAARAEVALRDFEPLACMAYYARETLNRKYDHHATRHHLVYEAILRRDYPRALAEIDAGSSLQAESSDSLCKGLKALTTLLAKDDVPGLDDETLYNGMVQVLDFYLYRLVRSYAGAWRRVLSRPQVAARLLRAAEAHLAVNPADNFRRSDHATCQLMVAEGLDERIRICRDVMAQLPPHVTLAHFIAVAAESEAVPVDEILKAVVERFGASPKALNTLGTALAQWDVATPVAIALLERAAGDTDLPGMFDGLALALKNAGRFEEAVRMEEKALARAPESMTAPFRLKLGDIYLAWKKRDEAEAAYAKAIELEPGWTEMVRFRLDPPRTVSLDSK